MKQGPALAAMAAIALLSLGCAGSPRQSPSAVPSSAGGPASAPAMVKPEFSDLAKRPIGHPAIFLSLPDPLPPTTRPASTSPARSALAVLPQSTLPQAGLPAATAATTPPALAPAPLPVPPPPTLSGAVPARTLVLPDGLLSIESLPDRLPAKLRLASASAVLALPVAPPAKAAPVTAASGAAPKTPAASSSPPAATGTPPAAKPATTGPTAPQAASGSVPAPLAAPSLPPAVPSTLPTVDPKAERQPDIARSIAVELGTRIEIPFDGTGWTYLGERDGKDGILYESRRYEGPGLVFVLNTGRPGDFILRFQKQDLLRGSANEELIAVKVTPKTAAKAPPPASGGALSQSPAPAQPPALPSATASAAKPAAGGASAPAAAPAATAAAAPQVTAPPASPAATGPGPSPSPAAFAASLPASPDTLLASAKTELAGGRVANALAALDRFLALRPEGLDELFYLYGVALEQNGPTKDIKKAYAWYKKLRDGYPQSQFWDLAAARMSYIERQYFDIR